MEYLLPGHLFEGLATGWLLLLLAVAVLAVAKGADWLVGGAVAFSQRAGIPKIIVGATVVSIGTTTPEAAVSVMSAWRGFPDLALGNSVGSIICDTGLIFGLALVLTRIPADRFVLNRHGWIQFGAGVLLVVVSLLFRGAEGERIIPRFIGFTFLALLAGYIIVSLHWARQHKGALEELEAEAAAAHAPGSPWKALGLLALGIILVVLASHIMIQCVRVLAERWGVPPSLLAATLIAFGTSLPELVTALAAIARGQPALLVGNIIGADILNVLFVTGAAATAAPLAVDGLFLSLHFPVMIGVLLVFRVAVYFAKDTFPRWPGVLLLLIYAGYIAQNVLLRE